MDDGTEKRDPLWPEAGRDPSLTTHDAGPRAGYLKLSSSTSNTRVELGGIAGGEPCGP